MDILLKFIGAGDVGYLITGIKNAKEVKVGDTILEVESTETTGVSGFEDVKPMVFAGIYPIDTEDYEELRNGLKFEISTPTPHLLLNN